MNKFRRWFWFILGLIIVYAAGAAAGNGLKEGGNTAVVPVKVKCVGECEKPFYRKDANSLSWSV